MSGPSGGHRLSHLEGVAVALIGLEWGAAFCAPPARPLEPMIGTSAAAAAADSTSRSGPDRRLSSSSAGGSLSAPPRRPPGHLLGWPSGCEKMRRPRSAQAIKAAAALGGPRGGVAGAKNGHWNAAASGARSSEQSAPLWPAPAGKRGQKIINWRQLARAWRGEAPALGDSGADEHSR